MFKQEAMKPGNVPIITLLNHSCIFRVSWFPAQTLIPVRIPRSRRTRDPLRSSKMLQSERGMRDPRGLVRLVLGDDDGDLDLRGADQLEVHAGVRQGLEESRGHAAVGSHADAD